MLLTGNCFEIFVTIDPRPRLPTPGKRLLIHLLTFIIVEIPNIMSRHKLKLKLIKTNFS